MKKTFFLLGLMTAWGAVAANDICLPSTLWMLSDTQNDIFVQPLIRRWRPYDDFVRFSAEENKMGFSRRLSRVASVSRPVEGAVLKTELVNGEEFETVKTVRSTIRVGTKGAGTKTVYAQILGDSFTNDGAFFKQVLLNGQIVPGLRLVGLRKHAEGQYDEGRGGWRMEDYFRPSKYDWQAYNGYFHPVDGRYWGATAFWQNAWMCMRKTEPKGFEPRYSCSRFDDFVDRFDEKTGVLLAPESGDYQYDSAKKAFLRYDGKAWQTVDEAALKWEFDYGKYLAMWKLTPPQFLFVMLGLNDFRENLNADFSTWGRQVAVVKDSYLKACPEGRFVICIPSSTCGSIDNAAGDFTPRQNAAMWRFRDWLIKTFDGREKDGFYLLDAGIGIDEENGFTFVQDGPAVPFSGCADGRIRVQKGTPHPYPNYETLGLPLAAFIQYYRTDK